MKILSLNYTQTGQMDDIMEQFLSPLEDVDIDRIKFCPTNNFPFPWTSKEFFDAMPETVLEKAIPLEEINYKYEKYDLIILGNQPWYLSPSLPVSSLLQTDEFMARLSGTPVIVIHGSRNMWINAQKSIIEHVENAGGKLIGNIPFVDRHHNLVSVITILHWMLKGKKTKKNKLFPKPGVSEEDIQLADKYGDVLKHAIKKTDFSQLQSQFISLGLIKLPIGIIFIELRAKKLFNIWAKLIKRKGNTPAKRTRLLKVFKYYLLFALFIVAPIVLLFYYILVLPFAWWAMKKKKNIFLTENFKERKN